MSDRVCTPQQVASLAGAVTIQAALTVGAGNICPACVIRSLFLAAAIWQRDHGITDEEMNKLMTSAKNILLAADASASGGVH